jgi:hypothetical protein
MRRALFVAAVAAALSAVVPATASQAATAESPATPAGSASASASVSATPGDGAFTITYPDGTYLIGRSTCLVVDGNIAYLTGRIDLSGGTRRVANAWGKGNYLVVGVEDNGNGRAQETPDRLNFSPGTATDPGCGPNAVATPDFVIVRGNHRHTTAERVRARHEPPGSRLDQRGRAPRGQSGHRDGFRPSRCRGVAVLRLFGPRPVTQPG